MTMTAEDLTTEIETRAERIRELTTTQAALEQSLGRTRKAIAAAIAGGAAGSGSARETVRTNSEELAGVKDAIDQLTRERSSLEAQLKRAQASEAIERADLSVTAAARSINAVDDAVLAAAKTLFALAGEANSKMNVANGDDQVAKSLNGQQTGIMPRIGWWQRPGLEELLNQIGAYARQHA